MQFPVTTVGLAAAQAALSARMQELSIPPAIRSTLSVILDEHVSNLIRHDRRISAADQFEADLEANGVGAVLVVRDHGMPFDPRRGSEKAADGPGGHGLSIIVGLADQIDYRAELTGNVLTAQVGGFGASD